jgi:thiol-disulfide isomerase/thioredoxin
MNSVYLLVALFLLGSLFGFWYQRSRGQIKQVAKNLQVITTEKIGSNLGDRATLLQFSSAFCTPCRATRTLLGQVIEDFPGIKHVEIDAESNLDLVRELNINSTPTTLFLDSMGREISRAVGAPKRSEVIAALNAMR